MAGKQTKPCKGCGGEKVPGKGFLYCETCIEERKPKRTCRKCGGPKPAGGGKRYCDDCRELAQWAVEKRRAYCPPRPCKTCGAVVVKGNQRRCEDCRNAPVMCQRCHANPRRGQYKKLCTECYDKSKVVERKRRLEWQRIERKDPIRGARKRERDKAYRKKREKDKDVRRRINETRRIWWRNTHGVKPLSEEAYRRGNGRGMIRDRVPAQPLQELIKKWLEDDTHSLSMLAMASDVEEKRLREVENGVVDTVQVIIADKVCMGAGTSLAYVYPDENPPRPDIAA